MLINKPNTLIYLQRSGVLAAGKRINPSRLDFPDTLVKNMEVILREKLIQTIVSWLSDIGVRSRRLIVVLDPSVLFEKTIKLDQTGQPDILMQSFIDAMPFAPGQRACLAAQTDTTLQLYATNAALYQAVIEALRTADAGKLIAVTPSTAYNLGNDERTISAAAARFFSDTNVPRRANFLDTKAL